MSVRIHPGAVDRLADHEIDPWRDIPTAVAADMSAEICVIDPAIKAVGAFSDRLRLFGRAVTVLAEPPDFGAVVHALDVVQAGDVLMIAAGGNGDTAMIGEILGGHLRARGCTGIVCDGAVRDVGVIGAWPDFAVFARSVMPRGPSSIEHGAINRSVIIGNCTVNPGDLIMGDPDGLVILSPAAVRTHLDAARAKLKKEAGWVSALASGRSARDVFGLPAPDSD